DSRPGRAPWTTRTASNASNCSSRPTRGPPGWWSPGGGTKRVSEAGCTHPHSATPTTPLQNTPAAPHQLLLASPANYGPAKSLKANPVMSTPSTRSAVTRGCLDSSVCSREHRLAVGCQEWDLVAVSKFAGLGVVDRVRHDHRPHP